MNRRVFTNRLALGIWFPSGTFAGVLGIDPGLVRSRLESARSEGLVSKIGGDDAWRILVSVDVALMELRATTLMTYLSDSRTSHPSSSLHVGDLNGRFPEPLPDEPLSVYLARAKECWERSMGSSER